MIGEAATLLNGKLIFSGGGVATVSAFSFEISSFESNKERKVIGKMISTRKDHSMNTLKLDGKEVALIYGGYERFIPSPKYSRKVSI